MTRALFVCSRNRLRSPTAEQWFAAWPGIETDSAGVAPDAESIVSREQIAWADIIFVMERSHKASLSKQFAADLRNKKIVCLDIPDKYAFMQPELIALLERRAGKFLQL
ncbi:low molecular weight protein tyrosine phosphatase family protein [Burkholderia ubonensis]|uniref:low molecular weight protein tyrosine phosphatase family protein n=1 Tax=Burkholderia ubonensis TaxID=101571 RepID=UPI002ABD7F8C|nr:low molecular weight protein tyrosine phosphatase family protein [Burkholderia ubonensis]